MNRAVRLDPDTLFSDITRSPAERARLVLALPGVDQRRIGTLVCVHRARFVTSPTHVDVMFSLAELPIEVRLSGLDRDPGWVPAADRLIAFHYEWARGTL